MKERVLPEPPRAQRSTTGYAVTGVPLPQWREIGEGLPSAGIMYTVWHSFLSLLCGSRSSATTASSYTWAHFELRFFCRPWPTLPSLRPLSAPPSPPLQTLIACLATFDLAPKVGHVNNRRNARNGPLRWERGCVTRPIATAVNPRAAPHGSPERITARACACVPRTTNDEEGREREAVSFRFPAAERRKKFIVGRRQRERRESSGETETGPRAEEADADMGRERLSLSEGPNQQYNARLPI